MKHTTQKIILTTMLFGASIGAIAADKTNNKVPCANDSLVARVAKEIPKHFKRTSSDTYLIEFVPEAKNGYGKGGQLAVYIPDQDSKLSVFDRTDMNPKNWYNVSNWNPSGNGCVDPGVFLENPNAGTYLSQDDSQSKFNAFIHKVAKKLGYEK